MLGPDSTARAAQLASIISSAGWSCTWGENTFKVMVEKEGFAPKLGGFSRGGGGSQATVYAPRDDAAFAEGLPKSGDILDLGTHKLRVTEPDDNPGSSLVGIKGTLTPSA